MEQITPPQPERPQSLTEKTLSMKQDAELASDQYDNLLGEIEQLQQYAKNNMLLTDDEQHRLKNISETLDKHTLFLSTLSELRQVQEALGKSEKEIRINLAHENAHANKASSLGLQHNGYRIIILKDGEIYQTNITIPENMDEFTAAGAYEQTLRAPEEYGGGGGLSTDDIKDLEQL